MTPKERAAMRLALEALEFCKKWASRIGFDAAITALREALAEQVEQEPVAWMQDRNDLYVADQRDKYYTVPLYAAPVRTKDLTDDEIEMIFKSHIGKQYDDFARAVIAADREKNK